MPVGSAAAAAAASNAIAIQAAHEAAEAKAMAVVKGFQHDTATIAERQEYAKSVAILYPKEVNFPVPLRAFGVAILIVLAFAAAGVVRGASDQGSFDGPLETGFIWGSVATVVLCLVALGWLGVWLAFF